ncbi:hypothetical protein ACFVHW_32460 [Streptomyces sp. NPDC127110]|uniref:hypothetical protein n=1 Tax=Streptomyces sp. NPDC127110 TaxID=3345362 RepID=UPI0036377479
MDDRPITPSGCRHCGVPEREHVRPWWLDSRWHDWAQPSDRQILRRMQMRRALRTAPLQETR